MTAAAAPARPPEYAFGWGRQRSFVSTTTPLPPPTTSRSFSLSPSLIAMVAVLATALLIVVYVRLLSRPFSRLWTRWRRRRRHRLLALASTDIDIVPSPAVGDYHYYSSGASSNYFLSPCGLDDAAIKALPVTLFSSSKGKNVYRDCAVCLFEFEDNDTLRTLPLCSHVFHMDCIDVWLRSHANCPLCRASIFHGNNEDGNSMPTSLPFLPMRAARIRPSFDDIVFDAPQLVPALHVPEPDGPVEIGIESQRLERREFLLERSYSFGFETTRAMMTEASTPWRNRNRTFWSKRWQSPFILPATVGGGSSSSRAVRVFSFRSYRGVNVRSPFIRKRGGGGMFFPLSESRVGTSGGFGPGSRRTRSLTSPVAFFSRPWGAPPAAGSGSSRLRCGDPEALLSPERLNRR